MQPSTLDSVAISNPVLEGEAMATKVVHLDTRLRAVAKLWRGLRLFTAALQQKARDRKAVRNLSAMAEIGRKTGARC